MHHSLKKTGKKKWEGKPQTVWRQKTIQFLGIPCMNLCKLAFLKIHHSLKFMAKRTFDDFDVYANEYRNIHTDNINLSGVDSYYFAKMKITQLQNYEHDVPLQVLDIGCGDGTSEMYMQQLFPNWKVKGIDVSEKSIAEATKKNKAGYAFEVYNGSDIPQEDGSVDIVFIAGVLHHVSYELHAGLMKEIYRVLKKGGRLYLFEHNPLNPVTRHLVNTCIFDEHAKLLFNSYAKKIIRQGKLIVTNNTFIIFFPRKGILSRLIFAEKYLAWLPLGGQYFIRAVKV
jgi:ubiquinone/menaquinone biosynthesis C-methylase UbiE